MLGTLVKWSRSICPRSHPAAGDKQVENGSLGCWWLLVVLAGFVSNVIDENGKAKSDKS